MIAEIVERLDRLIPWVALSPGGPEQIARAVSVAWLIYLVALAGWIVMQRRSPVSTLAWVMSLAWLPYIGFVIYYFFGPVRIRRQRLRRDRAKRVAHGRNPTPTPLAWSRLEAQSLEARHQRLGESFTAMPLSSCSAWRFLVDGAQCYRALIEAIAGARDHVHLEYYILEPDRAGTRLRDALVERARAGVKVKLLVDAVGSSAVRRSFLAPLVAAGGQVAWFHPFRLAVLKPMLNLRTHRKIAIVDGRIGFTGGINITDLQDEEVNPKAFRDLHLRFEGPAVHGLQTVFLEDWLYAHGRVPQREGLYPDLPGGQVALQWLPSGPDTSWEPIHRAIVQAIGDARERVWLVTPYFVPTEAALMALQNASRRGVQVRVLVPRRADTLLVTLAARSYFQDLTAAGCEVREYLPRMLHTKALLVDEAVAIVGSANFDVRSFRLNFELCAALYGEAPTRELARLIEVDWAQGRPVSPRRWPAFHHRLAESTARLFSPML